MDMKIYLGSIDSLGEHLSCDLLIGDFAFDRRGSSVEVDEGAVMSFDIYNTGDHWAVQGSGKPEVTTVCDRCLKEAHLQLDIDFSVQVLRRPAGGGRTDDDDEGASDGEGKIPQIDDERCMDLGPRVREEIIMAMPVKVLCREECQGLCPVCGQDMNQGDCDCTTDFVDPRLESLAKLKQQMKDDQK